MKNLFAFESISKCVCVCECVPVRVPCHLVAIKERALIKKTGELTQFKACLYYGNTGYYRKV